MPPKNKTASSTPVEVLKHEDKRVYIPTADAHDLVSEEAAAVGQLIYPRNPALDPQMVWRGKDTQDLEDLVVDAPPIYVQEKVAPRFLIHRLARETATRRQEAQPMLFEDDFADFDGVDAWESVEYYEHQANWSNRMILGDSVQVMASLMEKENLRGKVQMIYMDPPYGIKFGSNWQASTRKRDVKDGSPADATREVEQIKAFRDTWKDGIFSYLSYLRDRLVVGRDMLTESGSVFVQIGDENVHVVRSLLDEVFGRENFVSLITVKKTSTGTGDFLSGVSDYVVWYARNIGQLKYRQLYRVKSVGGDGAAAYTQIELPDGTRRPATKQERQQPETAPPGARFFRPSPLTSDAQGREKGEGAASWFPVELQGRTYRPSMKVRWKTNEAGMERLKIAGRLVVTGNTLNYVRYIDDFPAFPLTNLWDDTQSGSGMEKVYVVQTNTKVVERCMLMTTDPGDLVIDPTCGSGTTAVAAEQWGRRWITMDTSRVAIALARQRLLGAKLPCYLLADSTDGRAKEQELTGLAQPDGPVNGDVRKGFVYERVPHVTLKSIATNPEIKSDMTATQIEKIITRHSESELLFDRPFEDRRKVRVAGPFTVESLSPHRSASFKLEGDPSSGASDDSFLTTVLDNLLAAGVQNGWRNERLEFSVLSPHAGKYIQAEGERRNADNGTPRRIAVSVGPQYGTVSADWIKGAAREALRGMGFDLLVVCGFAFDAHAGSTAEEFKPNGDDFAAVQEERKIGKLPILLVRMNADLAMGDALLKKTGSANLFTVFGEPDITIDQTTSGLVVEIRGVDVYNPTTLERRSSGADDIAMWMIDTEYGEDNFFVRHCYFSGKDGKPDGLDPYTRLRKALHADIDEIAWATLYSTRSQPFPRPGTGRIAVKVINHFGDEVLKVYEV